MPFRIGLSIRQKIIISCVIILSPVVLLSYLLARENSSYVKQQKLDSISTRATLVQLSLDELIDSTTKFLENMAQTPEVKTRDRVASNQLFTSIFPLYPNFTTFGAVDEQGRVLSGVQRGGNVSFTLSDRPYFQEVLKTGRPAVSGWIMGRASEQPIFVIAVPVRDNEGRVSGALTAGISLRQIQQLLERLGQQEAGDAIVVDAAGDILSHPNWKYVSEETKLSSFAPIQLALSGKRGTTEHEDPLDGNNWLWSYQPLTQAPWAVAVRYPASAVYSSVYEILLRWLFYLLAALTVALILAFFTADKAVRPLGLLRKRIATTAPAGSIVAPVQPYVDEMHELTRIFDGLCTNLKQTSEELEGVKGELAQQAAKLEVLAQRAIDAREDERRRIAMDIHDGVLQLIAAAQGEARLARAATGSHPDVATLRLGQVETALDRALYELRGIAKGMHPLALEQVDLVHAIYSYLTTLKEIFAIPQLGLQVSGDAYRLLPETEMAVFRIVQESLSNVGRHAGADRADVFIHFGQDYFRITIADDGKGFDVHSLRHSSDSHHGLANLRERAERIGASCNVLSMSGAGTRVEVEVPVAGSVFDSPESTAYVRG